MKSIKMIHVSEPDLSGNELNYVKDCVQSGWISSIGKYVTRFEENFSSYIGCKYGIAVHNGTIALHLALASLNIGIGDEVIVPTLSFAATANAVLYTGAVPVLVDVENNTWNIDSNLVEQAISERTKAIIPVHLYGLPCDMDKILDIARQYNLYVIEDAAEAHGAEYKNTKVGSFGDVGCFSFFGNKILTTGEGGMCLVNNKNLANRMAKLRDHGMSKVNKYWHDEIGFNYRMTNLQAAVGCAQLERIEEFINKKKEIASWYTELLHDLESIELPFEAQYAKSSFWLFSILLKNIYHINLKDKLLLKLKDVGIETRPLFYPLHKMPPYKQDGKFDNAEYISRCGFSLPSGVTLIYQDVEYICYNLRKILAT